MYGRGMFAADDFVRLSERLRGLQGRFIMTLNDVPAVRHLFDWASIETEELTYHLAGGGKAKAVREVVISGGRTG